MRAKSRFETGRRRPSRSRHPNVRNGGPAGPPVFLGIEGNLLTLAKTAQTGTLQRCGMDENVLAAAVRLDESEAFLIVVKLYCAVRHKRILSETWTNLSRWPSPARTQPGWSMFGERSERAPSESP